MVSSHGANVGQLVNDGQQEERETIASQFGCTDQAKICLVGADTDDKENQPISTAIPNDSEYRILETEEASK